MSWNVLKGLVKDLEEKCVKKTPGIYWNILKYVLEKNVLKNISKKNLLKDILEYFEKPFEETYPNKT